MNKPRFDELWNIDDEEMEAIEENFTDEQADEYWKFSDELKIMETLGGDNKKVTYVIHKMLDCCEADRRFIGLMLLDYLRSCSKQEIKELVNELENN